MSDPPELAAYDTPDAWRRRESDRGLENLRNPVVREWLEKKKRSLTPVEFVRAMATFCERPVWIGLAFPLMLFTQCDPHFLYEYNLWSGFKERSWDPPDLHTDAEFNRLLSPWIGPPPKVSNDQIRRIIHNEMRDQTPVTIVREMAKLTELPLRMIHVRSGLLWINPAIKRSVHVYAEKWRAVRPRWQIVGSLSDEQFNELLSPWIFPPPQRPRAVYR